MVQPWRKRRLPELFPSGNQLLHHDRNPRSSRVRGYVHDSVLIGQRHKGQISSWRSRNARTLRPLLAFRRHSLGIPVPTILLDLVMAMNTNYLYLLVFAVLIAETDIEVNLSSIIASNAYVSVLLGIAATKAILIAMFYQHLKYEPKSLSSWVIIGLVIASLLMGLSFVQLHVGHP